MYIQKLLLAALLCCLPLTGHATSLAQSLFKQYQNNVLQVRVIDIASGEKSSIGSGFAVQADGLIISNYHVVASFIKHPDQYRLEYAVEQGETGRLELIDIDIINDLAVLKRAKIASDITMFQLANRTIHKGEDIFSMGNPLDLGMTIIEGIYNGQPKHALYQRILFSGSLNPGMSGGPALNKRGEVIGVNVSTAGNDISFLVPAVYLKALLQRVRQEDTNHIDFQQRIETQLFQHQHHYLSSLLNTPWIQKPLTEQVKTPERIADFIQCWGTSEKDDDALYESISRSCANQESIYLGRWFKTGSMSYHIHLFKDKALGTSRFYTLYEDHYKRSRFSAMNEDQTTETSCNADFVTQGEHTWKVNFCSRRYKAYPSLYDVSLNMAVIGESNQGLIANLKISGCGKEDGLKLAKKFMRSIQWQP